jgi:capsular polysaccharide biosynthesis protein
MTTYRQPDALAGMIASSLSADDRHRIVELSVTGSVPADADDAADSALTSNLEHIAGAVVEELDQNAGHWFAFLGEDEVTLTLIDQPDPAQRLPPSLRQRLDLPLRIAVATLLALALASLLHGLDPRLHDPQAAAQAADAPVLAQIPRR